MAVNNYNLSRCDKTMVSVTPELNFWWADVNKRNRNITRKRICFWELVIVSEGSARFTSAERQICLKRNDYILLPPSTGQHTMEGVEDWAGSIVTFEDSAQKMNSRVACIPRPKRTIHIPCHGTIEGNPLVIGLINQLCSCWQKQSITREQAGVVTESLLIMLLSQPFPSDIRLRRPLAEMVRIYLTDHWNEDISAEDIAREAGCSSGYLARMFRKSYHMTIRQMQMQLRVEKACLYIRSDFSLHEVADACGFNDYYHFLRVFKEITGITTGEYRRNSTPS